MHPRDNTAREKKEQKRECVREGEREREREIKRERETLSDMNRVGGVKKKGRK